MANGRKSAAAAARAGAQALRCNRQRNGRWQQREGAQATSAREWRERFYARRALARALRVLKGAGSARSSGSATARYGSCTERRRVIYARCRTHARKRQPAQIPRQRLRPRYSLFLRVLRRSSSRRSPFLINASDAQYSCSMPPLSCPRSPAGAPAFIFTRQKRGATMRQEGKP